MGDGLVNLLWLALFVVIGLPVALGIELFWRGRAKSPAAPRNHDDNFLPLPADSGIARHMTRASESGDL